MSVTHYWRRSTELPEKPFARAVTDCEKLLGELGVALGGFDGTGQPIFDTDHIVFNGAHGQHGEAFEISRVEFDRRGRAEVRSFCKTEHLPYDMCVKVCLVILKHHLGDGITVTTDALDVDWADAIDAVHQSLGYGRGFSLETR